MMFVRIDPAGIKGTTRQPDGNDSTTHENQGTHTSLSLPESGQWRRTVTQGTAGCHLNGESCVRMAGRYRRMMP
jgi:hypothetical protein